MTSASILPTYFISHGGGPWPYMADQIGHSYDLLAASLRDIPRQIGHKPKAVLVISAHWEAPAFTVMTHPQPPMVYDYYGFPPHTYQVRYDAPGSPALASRVELLLGEAGLPVRRDGERGFDHGTFAPLVVMYPQADVPIVQLSLREDYDPAAHLALGRAIAPLRHEDVLIVGSGLSYHNLRQFRQGAQQPSKAFDGWLAQTLLDTAPAERERKLIDWAQAPSARQAHPQEDHLLPLMVAAGAAGAETAHRFYHEEQFMGGVVVSSYRFGEPLAPG